MELKDQVCSLELAKKLKELGVKRGSIFHYEYDNKDSLVLQHSSFYSVDGINAYSVAELGEMLPEGSTLEKYGKYKGHDVIRATMHGNKYNSVPAFCEYTEADARAKMLIYLIEKGMVKP